MHRNTLSRRIPFGAAPVPALALFAFAACSTAGGQMPGQKMPGLVPIQVQQIAKGIRAMAGKEVLEATVCSDHVIHVVAVPQPLDHQPARPWMLGENESCPGAPFTFAQDDKSAVLRTATIEVALSLERGNLSFRSLTGEILLNEGSAIPRTYEQVESNGDHTYRVTDRFSPSVSEAFYGLGQHQNGMFNYRGSTVELGQNNTDVAIPLLVSSKGYALMWNTAALTYVDNRFPLDLVLDSIAGKSVDYYFLYGPEIDTVLHEYRGLTGHAPMLPNGLTVSFNRRIVTLLSMKCGTSPAAIDRRTSRSMRWFRIGSGGRPKAIQCSTRTITTWRKISTPYTKRMCTP